jgi:RHS repeat-associated protein
LDRKFGINAYDFTGRFYDITDDRFWSMDPMAEKYYSISPYAYCGNNPLNRVDPTGMIWDDPKAAEELKNVLDQKIEHLSQIKTNYQTQVDNGDLSKDKVKDLNKKIVAIENRVSQMGQSKSDIDQLGSDKENTYVLNNPGGNDGNVTQGNDGKVYINSPKNGLAVHEIKHVSQSLNAGGLNFNNGILQNAGTSNEKRGLNEVDAYKAQFSLNGFFPGVNGMWSPNEITLPLIKAMNDKEGKLMYPYLSEKK